MNKVSEIPSWKADMYAEARHSEKTERTEIFAYYLKLQEIGDKYYKTGEIKEGDSFVTPLTSGAAIKFTYYESGSTLDVLLKNYKNNKIVFPLVTREDAARKEYASVYGFEVGCISGNYGIGAAYPEKFVEKLKSAKVGDVLRFGKSGLFVCKENETDKIILVPVREKFEEKNKISINYFNKVKLQNFYDMYKESDTNTFNIVHLSVEKTKDYVIKAYSELRSGVSQYKIGPFSVSLTKDNNGYHWYDSNGDTLTEKQVKYMIGWANCEPVHTSYRRISEDRNNQTVYADTQNKTEIETLYNEGHFIEAATKISNYVKMNEDTVCVDVKSYLPDNKGNYAATGYVFHYENSECVIYKANYANNDIKCRPVKLEKSSAYDFVDFCEQKFNETYTICLNDAYGLINDRYEPALDERIQSNRNTVAAKMAEHNALNRNIQETTFTFNANDTGNLVSSLDNEAELTAREFTQMETEKEFEDLEQTCTRKLPVDGWWNKPQKGIDNR